MAGWGSCVGPGWTVLLSGLILLGHVPETLAEYSYRSRTSTPMWEMQWERHKTLLPGEWPRWQPRRREADIVAAYRTEAEPKRGSARVGRLTTSVQGRFEVL